jgi:crotonobetainyl-CoA:carnitine CoA-transferase CaiB-like acyl-CoA transferase
MPGNPIKLSRMAEGPHRRFPAAGEHTAQVLSDLLGLDSGEIERLHASGALGS